jgi:hypothetical protein
MRGRLSDRERGRTDRQFNSTVITGLVPVISMRKSAAPQTIGMAGTRPAVTGRV